MGDGLPDSGGGDPYDRRHTVRIGVTLDRSFDNVIGSWVEFTVTAPSAQTVALTFRFANGSTTNRPMDIAINGTVVAAASRSGRSALGPPGGRKPSPPL